MRSLRWASAGLMLFGACGPSSAPRPAPHLTIWAWAAPQDLRAEPTLSVAFLARTLRLDPTGAGPFLAVEPRRNPLLLAPGAPLPLAVVRIELAHRAPLAPARAPELIPDLLLAAKNARGLQIDFDARASDRPFYTALLTALRPQLSVPLSITALASWCLHDRWLPPHALDAAVPMLFEMGPDDAAVRRFLARQEPWPEPVCNGRAGLSTTEAWPPLPVGVEEVFVFHPSTWDPPTLAGVRARL